MSNDHLQTLRRHPALHQRIGDFIHLRERFGKQWAQAHHVFDKRAGILTPFNAIARGELDMLREFGKAHRAKFTRFGFQLVRWQNERCRRACADGFLDGGNTLLAVSRKYPKMRTKPAPSVSRACAKLSHSIRGSTNSAKSRPFPEAQYHFGITDTGKQKVEADRYVLLSNGFFGLRNVSRTGTAPKPRSRRMPLTR